MPELPSCWNWFKDARYGLFIHWGPYAMWGRGEQVLFREHLDPVAYEKRACEWNPTLYNPREWAEIVKRGGFKYACLTTRHHDGYCLWDTDLTDYSAPKQAAGRDLVAEYVEAFREAGLKVGLYYSLCDWRIPAYYEGPEKDPAGWGAMRDYIHGQVEELLTRYGKIDHFFFDGRWPRTTEDVAGVELLARMRELQPGILVNNRLGKPADAEKEIGDFGTPEHRIQAEADRLWESCQVTTWRLWGYTHGERWRRAEQWLDLLCTCASQDGNLLLNVGPMADGRMPGPFIAESELVGEWLDVHGEAVFGPGAGDVTEAVTYGYQTVRGNNLYLIFRFWPGEASWRMADLLTPVKRATLLSTGQELGMRQSGEELWLDGLPTARPTPLFPVIKLECDGAPAAGQWGRERLWGGDPQRVADWARQRGNSVWVGGKTHNGQA